MSNEQNSTIHDFDFDLICESFLDSERQGPGSCEMTLRALSFIEPLGTDARIADMGCGTGGQTMTLARATEGHITGLDLFPKFIDRLRQQAHQNSLQNRVEGIVGTMEAPPFEKGSLDLIWSEGAMAHVGFEHGLRLWRELLKPRGWVAVTDNTWFTDAPPAEIVDFWVVADPGIDTVSAKIAAMSRAGYDFVAAFALPPKCWADYYAERAEVQNKFLEKYPEAAAFIASQREEEALWEAYKANYGYVFYIGRRRD